MRNKIFLLVTIFLLIALQSISSETSSRKNSKTDDNSEVVVVNNKKKPSRVDNDDQQQYSSNRRDRLSQFGSSSNNPRSRSRWQSSSYDRDDLDEWSPYGSSIMGNIPMPLPPSAYETGPYLSNGPSCYPLLDPQYPIFSDLCGAVPQARYALPNAFGHVERWQIAQTLTAILGPVTPTSGNPVCTRSLRLLLCPLLFPPCPTRYEAPPVLPCQPFCRVVKAQCASPGLELLPCDLLPPTSDLCPVNPTPYSSLLSSFMPPMGLNGPLPPHGLPPSALSALLTQSALTAGIPPSNMPPMPFSSMMTPGDMPPAAIAAMMAAHSGFGPGMTSPGAQGPSAAAMMAAHSGFGSGMTSPGAQGPSAAAMMAAQSGFGPGMTPPGGPGSSALASLLSASGMSPSGMLSPMNPYFNSESLMGDNMNPILVDFPPMNYGQRFSQPSRYFPSLRSATEEA